MGNILWSSSDSPQSESSSSFNYPTFTYKEREYSYIGDHEQELEDFKCAICLSVLAEPLLTSCGHLFCDDCIDGIHDNCPTCRGNFTTSPDRFIARKIGDIKVKCPNEGRGCLWTGTLGESEDHLGNRCDYEEVQCKHCDHRGDRKEVNSLHPTWCEKLPLYCPECAKPITRATLEDHLEQCPEQFLACKFAFAGCMAIVSRKNFDEHLRVDSEKHDRLCMDRIEQLSSAVITNELSPNGDNSSNVDGDICYRPWLCSSRLRRQPTAPHILSIERQTPISSSGFEVESDPFYSHPFGYKFILHVEVSSGYFAKYINASVHLLEGENDDHLMFPFKGTLILSLMNQCTDGEHLEKVVQLNPQFCQKMNLDMMQDSGILSRCKWKESSSSVPSYVVGGRLYIKVSSFDFDHDYMSSCVHE